MFERVVVEKKLEALALNFKRLSLRLENLSKSNTHALDKLDKETGNTADQHTE